VQQLGDDLRGGIEGHRRSDRRRKLQARQHHEWPCHPGAQAAADRARQGSDGRGFEDLPARRAFELFQRLVATEIMAEVTAPT
jgi:hypothetical protein